jgi:hypothetical protein
VAPWKMHLFQPDEFMSTWTPYNMPHLHNLEWDPREENQVGFPHGWVAHPMAAAAVAFLKTLATEPPIRPGTPDPYLPLQASRGPGRGTPADRRHHAIRELAHENTQGAAGARTWCRHPDRMSHIGFVTDELNSPPVRPQRTSDNLSKLPIVASRTKGTMERST